MVWKMQLIKLLLMVLAVFSATWTPEASASGYIPQTNHLGVWIYEFRLCVQGAVDSGTPLEEARLSCASLLRIEAASTQAPSTSASADVPAQDNFGVWLLEFRLCVQGAVDSGTPLEEARQSCSTLAEPIESAVR